ncbi:MAG: archaeoflavoprotein AfpA, partial [Methanimicrococcus sp.]|nr:archaeoflavoprotein AfpA [Methanimicrococcus sp.]
MKQETISQKTFPQKAKRLAWGITGAGDKLAESVAVMEEIKNLGYAIDVFASREGERVLKCYKLLEGIQSAFSHYYVEKSANSPFIPGFIQTGMYEALIISPASANTTAKIVHGIGDSLLSNAVAQTTKCGVPVFIYPVDSRKGSIKTKAPNGHEFELKMREIDIKNAK